MKYDNFEGQPLPLLLERIKIKPREQSIDFFEYGKKFEPQPVYLKSEYVSNRFPNYKKQAAFDKRLLTFQWADLQNYGPPIKEFIENLEKFEGLDVIDYNSSSGNGVKSLTLTAR